jgi:hypothetical protein
VQPLIAAATFVANVAATRLVAKVPVVLPVQVFDPADPPVAVAKETSAGVPDNTVR